MKIPVCLRVAAALLLFQSGSSAITTITTTHESWAITFNKGTWVAGWPTHGYASETDANTVADIVDPSTAAASEVRGVVDGFKTHGFKDPRIDFKNIFLDHIDLPASAPAGSQVDGNANRARIKFNTDTLPAASVAPSAVAGSPTSLDDLRATVTHEMFHGVEYAYCNSFLGIDQEDAIGGLFTEGLAATMEDKIWNSVDTDIGSGYLSRVGTYLSGVNFDTGAPSSLWSHSYSGALWWTYLTEQYGTTRTEPGVGNDFIKHLLENTDSSDSTSNYELMEMSIADRDRQSTWSVIDKGTPLDDLFIDFCIANGSQTKTAQLNFSAVGSPDRYSYVDDAARNYGEPSIQETLALSSTSGALTRTGSFQEMNARYYDVTISPTCTGIVGFSGSLGTEGDEGAFALLARKGDSVVSLHQAKLGPGGAFSVVLAQPPLAADYYTGFRLVLAGLDGGTKPYVGGTLSDSQVDYSVTFACGSPTMNIVEPNSAYPAYVDDKAAPERFLVKLQMTGPSALGEAFVQGLQASDFTVYVGTVDPANKATVINGVNVAGQFWLTCQAPVKTAATTTYNLTVQYRSLATDTEQECIIYQPRLLDQMLVLDRSGSMDSPSTGTKKIDAARNAAALFTDLGGSNDQLGLVAFNENATLLYPLQTMSSDLERFLLKWGIYSAAPTGTTSIGDGLDTARLNIAISGQPAAEHWAILLSDGAENAPNYYSSIKAALLTAGVRVQVIGVGPSINEDLLKQIADETGGDYFYVDVSATSPSSREAYSGGGGGGASSSLWFCLADAFVSAEEKIRRHERIWESQATLASSGSKTWTINVAEGGISDARLSFFWGTATDTLNFTVTRPDGSTATSGVGGVQVHTGDSTDGTNSLNLAHWVMHLPALGAGTWTITAQATSGSPALYGTLSGRNKQGAQSSLWFSQVGIDTALPTYRRGLRGLPMRLLFDLTDHAGALTGCTVDAEITNPRQPVVRLPLYDDGCHGDGQPGDGIYAADYTPTINANFSVLNPPETPAPAPEWGSYQVVVKAGGTDHDGRVFSRIEKGSFQISDVNDNPTPDADGDTIVTRYEQRHLPLNPALADAANDSDGDTLINLVEYQIGTDPAQPDTDHGGENDASELARGANPLDPRDDLVRRPVEGLVVTQRRDEEVPGTAVPNSLLIRPGMRTDYSEMRLFRRTGTAAFTQVATIPAGPSHGLYRDTGLTVGTKYDYYLVSVGTTGSVSAPGPVFSGTVRGDMIPPGGHFGIGSGASRVTSTSVMLNFDIDADTTQFAIQNQPALGSPLVWQAASATRAWTLAPNSAGLARVYVWLRDAAGNQSVALVQTVRVVSAPALGTLLGDLKLPWALAENDARISLPDYPWLAGPRIAADGTFTLPLVDPGPVRVLVEAAGFAPRLVTGVVTAGGVLNLGELRLNPLDRDGDGVADAAEERLGTNPAQYDSPLQPLMLPASAGSLRFQWRSAPGLTFRLQQSSSPGSWTPVEDIPGTNGFQERTLTVPNGIQRRFYKIDLLEP